MSVIDKNRKYSYFLNYWFDFALFSHSYVNFDADYDSDGLKVVSLFFYVVNEEQALPGPNILYMVFVIYRAWQSAKTLTEHERFRH